MQIARVFVFVGLLFASRPAGATLAQVQSFGSNPGALAMYEYVPANLASGRPLVVVLHGCTQTASSMEAAGWNALADQLGFAVVYPQQQSANNPVTCFNWAGEYGDTANLVRGQGENQSILSMVDHAIATHGSDPARVYIVGFSAGAAFVAVMLATWPERFAGGAIMSGVPYRCATSVSGAYSCQNPGVSKTAAQWGDLVRGASSFTGTRPPLQIWHGQSDSTVMPANEDELIKQWTNVAGTDDVADETTTIAGATRTAYKAGGRTVVEAFEVPSMGHAVAVGGAGCPATAGAYFEDHGICATAYAAAMFGLSGSGTGGTDVVAPTVSIVSPAEGDTVTGEVTIVVAANDDVGATSVALSIDGVDVPPDTEAPFQFDWDATAAGPGDHELIAIASDAAGNTATATAHVIVPGDGNGNGSGSDDPGGPSRSDALPGCSLDAGGGGTGGASLVLSIAFVTSRRRRRRS